MNKQKGFLMILVVVILLVIIGFTWVFPKDSVVKDKFIIEENENSLNLVIDGEVVQVLELDEESILQFEYVKLQPDAKKFITDMDVNFDGINDVGVFSQTGYGGVNNYYTFYVYDPENGSLNTQNALMSISNPTIDLENKTIISAYKDGPFWFEDKIIYQDEQYTKISDPKDFEDKSKEFRDEYEGDETINNDDNSVNLEGVIGVSFKSDDPSIIHPFTKNLSEKKSKISDDVIEDSNGILFFRDDDEIIVELERYICCGGGQTTSLYVYANDYDDLITVITFEHEYQFESSVDVPFIKELIPYFKSEIKPTMPILKSPPSDSVDDGYYYIELIDWNTDLSEFRIDFLTISDSERGQEGYLAAFDILMSSRSRYYSYWTNIELDNNLINTRVFSVNDSLVSKRNEGTIELVKNAYYFIKIQNGEISEMTMVVQAG